MVEARIIGVATGVRGQQYDQQQLLEGILRTHREENPLTEKIFQNAGVAQRYAVIEDDYYAQERGTQERNERYMAEALPLGEETVRACLDRAGLRPAELDDFLVVSCTGLDIPGLDLRLAGRLEMRPDLRRTCVLGMGCYAAFPALNRAREAVLAAPGRNALVLALELCSLHFQRNDSSTENMVSAALFADGAAAAIVRSEEGGETGANGASRGPRLVDAETYCDYQTFEHMAFHLTDTGFRMRLTAYVPELLAAKVEALLEPLLERNGLDREEVRFWGVHPGSAKILDYVAQRLELDGHALDHSRAVLRAYGNMSSATILFVLDAIQTQEEPQPGDHGVLMAFGPGLTMEAALVRW